MMAGSSCSGGAASANRCHHRDQDIAGSRRVLIELSIPLEPNSVLRTHPKDAVSNVVDSDCEHPGARKFRVQWVASEWPALDRSSRSLKRRSFRGGHGSRLAAREFSQGTNHAGVTHPPSSLTGDLSTLFGQASIFLDRLLSRHRSRIAARDLFAASGARLARHCGFEP